MGRLSAFGHQDIAVSLFIPSQLQRVLLLKLQLKQQNRQKQMKA